MVEITRPNIFEECEDCEIANWTIWSCSCGIGLPIGEQTSPGDSLKIKFIGAKKIKLDCRENIGGESGIGMKLEAIITMVLRSGKVIDFESKTVLPEYELVECPHYGFLRARW